VKNYFDAYGPYAFGVFSLLIIWFAIVKPELNARSMDFEATVKIVDTLQSISATQNDITRSMDSTSKSMEITAKILEHTVTNLQEIQ